MLPTINVAETTQYFEAEQPWIILIIPQNRLFVSKKESRAFNRHIKVAAVHVTSGRPLPAKHRRSCNGGSGRSWNVTRKLSVSFYTVGRPTLYNLHWVLKLSLKNECIFLSQFAQETFWNLYLKKCFYVFSSTKRSFGRFIISLS